MGDGDGCEKSGINDAWKSESDCIFCKWDVMDFRLECCCGDDDDGDGMEEGVDTRCVDVALGAAAAAASLRSVRQKSNSK